MSTQSTTLSTWGSWLAAEAGNWLFVIRTVLAMLLALLIAFRFDLSSPGSAAVTVSIISLPQAGMVLEKSFYRLMGTVLGAVVTLVLVAVFVQHRDSFILAVALWIGLCTAAASWYRGFQAYGWVLCGYTTCLIGFPAFLDANSAFDIAVDRVTIVGVGILSAGAVNALIFPLRSTTTLVQLVRRCYTDFVAFAELATRTGEGAAIGVAHHKFSRDLAHLEATRSASLFEDPGTRLRNRRLFALLGAFMVATSRLHLLHRQLDILESRNDQTTLRALEKRLSAFRAALRIDGHVPASAAEALPIARQLAEILEQPSLRPASSTPAVVSATPDWEGTALLIDEAIEQARQFAASYADMISPRSVVPASTTKLPTGSDPLQAAISGLRAAFVIVTASVFWIATAWPEGLAMTLIGTVGCALFSSAAQPVKAAFNMCKGFLIAIPALVVCFSLLLPAASDFYSLALVLTPFLVLGAWLMTRSGKSLIGAGFFLSFLTSLNIAGLMNYDAIGLFNNTLGFTMGIVIATVSLAVVVPGSRSWRSDRARKVLFQSLRAAATEPLDGLRAGFEGRVRDLTLSLIDVREPQETTVDEEFLGLLVLEIGDAIIRLRLHAPDELKTAGRIESLLCSIVSAVERQNAAAIEESGRALSRFEFANTPVEAESAIQRVLSVNSLEVALADLRAFLSSTSAGGATHAA